MNLLETLKRMKETMGENFYPSVEAMRRRANKGLIEGVKSEDIDNVLEDLESKESIEKDLDESAELTKLISETQECINKFNYEDNKLNEAVTFIDNAGNLKTMSTPDYVKDMHEYHTETQIGPYKKRKKIDYKLISENEFKKLSEMSIDDILNEADASTEILNNLRSDLQDELGAIKGYEEHADTAEAAGLKDIADVLRDIGKEEKVHCGELQSVLNKYDDEIKKSIKDGEKEAEEMLDGGSNG